MTSEEFVKQKYPKATAERHIKNNNEVYWLIRTNRTEYYYFSSGKTKSNAWDNAKNKIFQQLWQEQ